MAGLIQQLEDAHRRAGKRRYFVTNVQNEDMALQNYRNRRNRFTMKQRPVRTFDVSDIKSNPPETKAETCILITLLELLCHRDQDDPTRANLQFRTLAQRLIDNGMIPAWILDPRYSSFVRQIRGFMMEIFPQQPKSLPPANTGRRYTMDFEETEELGKGGFGSVYKARHKIDGRYYAIKKIAIYDISDDVDKILHEVKILASLDDPHIVRYHSTWIEEKPVPVHPDNLLNGQFGELSNGSCGRIREISDSEAKEHLKATIGRFVRNSSSESWFDTASENENGENLLRGTNNEVQRNSTSSETGKPFKAPSVKFSEEDRETNSSQDEEKILKVKTLAHLDAARITRYWMEEKPSPLHPDKASTTRIKELSHGSDSVVFAESEEDEKRSRGTRRFFENSDSSDIAVIPESDDANSDVEKCSRITSSQFLQDSDSPSSHSGGQVENSDSSDIVVFADSDEAEKSLKSTGVKFSEQFSSEDSETNSSQDEEINRNKVKTLAPSDSCIVKQPPSEIEEKLSPVHTDKASNRRFLELLESSSSHSSVQFQENSDSSAESVVFAAESDADSDSEKFEPSNSSDSVVFADSDDAEKNLKSMSVKFSEQFSSEDSETNSSQDEEIIPQDVKTLVPFNDPHFGRYQSPWVKEKASPVHPKKASNGQFKGPSSNFDCIMFTDGSDAANVEKRLKPTSVKFSEEPSEDYTATSSSLDEENQKGTLYIQMELCEGSLREWLEERNSEEKSLMEMVNDIKNRTIIQGMLKGVVCVHAKGIIHRDLKPENIFLKEETNTAAKIGDFGLATSREKMECKTLGKGRKFLTQGVGTVMYSSPEQQTRTNYDTKSDIYSLGLIIYEMYYPSKTIMERLKAFLMLRDNRKIDGFVSQNFPQIAEMILAMTRADPEERPTAKELLAQVQPPSSDEIIRCKNEEIARLHEEIKRPREIIQSKNEEIARQNEEIARLNKEIKRLKLQLEKKHL